AHLWCAAVPGAVVGTPLPAPPAHDGRRVTATDAPPRLARSSAVVGTGTLVSRLTGVVRVGITAAVLGQTVFADTYNAANLTPNILYELLVGGILTAALVPVFVDAHDAHDDEATSAVFTVAMTAVLL